MNSLLSFLRFFFTLDFLQIQKMQVHFGCENAIISHDSVVIYHVSFLMCQNSIIDLSNDISNFNARLKDCQTDTV